MHRGGIDRWAPIFKGLTLHTARMAARRRAAGFVGRLDEFGRLEDALQRAQRGTPRTVLLGGDAGVGKSRLVAEFCRHARAEGARVVSGGCLALGDGGLPFSVVTEALRRLEADVGLPELRRLAGEDTAELARVVPALRSAADEDAHTSSPTAPMDASSQLRLFEALLRLIHRVAAEAPLVLVLEDVHWADASTRDLLVFLAHNLRAVGVVGVVTFRTDELHRQHPLRPVLAGVARGGAVERLDLEPFDPGDVALLVEEILGQPPAPEVIERVHERSQGNPFYIEELLAAGVEMASLPESLRDILLVTVDELPTEVASVLRAVAAAGGEVRHELLARVAGSGQAELAQALRTAVERGVLVTDPPAGTYAFRHALQSEAVYSTLLPGELGALHAELAAAIEAEPELATRSAVAELAHHWHIAADQPRSLVASMQAAREAEAAAGVVEACRHLDRVLSLWPQVDDAAGRVGMDHTSVMSWAAELCYSAGDLQRAVALQEHALDSDGLDPARRALMHERLGRFRWVAGDGDGAHAAYVEAVELMPPEPSAERARVLASYSQLLMLSFRLGESDAYGEEALAMARDVGARAVEGHALTNLGTNLGWRGDERGLELLRDARAIAEELGAHDDIMRSYFNESGVLGGMGRFDEAIAVAREGMQRARDLGIEGIWGGGLVGNLAAVALYAGWWATAEQALRSAPRATGGVGAGWAHLAQAYLLAARGEVEAARVELAAAREARVHVLDQSKHSFLRTQLWVAVLNGEVGDGGASADAGGGLGGLQEGAASGASPADALAEALVDDDLPAGELVNEDVLELRAFVLWALAERSARTQRELDLAASVLVECRELASRFDARKPMVGVWLALAEAEYARLVAADDATQRWATAVARCDEVGLAYHGACARVRYVRALLDQGSREGVADLLTAARETASILDAKPLELEVSDLARRARIDVGGVKPSSPSEALGLTAREAEVLALLAEGRSNPEIAAELYISRKTASVHVSNILGKLQVSSRGEAAAVAHRVRLRMP